MTRVSATVHHPQNLLGDCVRPAQNVGLPVAEDDPTGVLERTGLLAIALRVPSDLRDPVVRVRSTAELGESALEVAAMPEISVAEDDDALLAEHDIRATWQPWMVKAIAETALPQLPSQRQLAAGVGFLAGTARSGGSLLGRGDQPPEGGCRAHATHRAQSLPHDSPRDDRSLDAMSVPPAEQRRLTEIEKAARAALASLEAICREMGVAEGTARSTSSNDRPARAQAVEAGG
jgi:hypothetical protein